MKKILLLALPIFFYAITSSGQTVNKGPQTQGSPSGVGTINWTSNPFDNQVFVGNEGQFTADLKNGEKILYGAKLGKVYALITNRGLIYKYIEFPKAHPANDDDDKDKDEVTDPDADGPPLPPIDRYLTGIWEGANTDITTIAGEEQTYYCTYPTADSKGTIIAHAFKTITCQNVYPGIDIKYMFTEGKEGMKYILIVHPGADLSLVKLKYAGAENMTINSAGDVEINAGWGQFVDHAPVSFYQGDNSPVASAYKVTGTEESFTVNNLDPSKTLIVDPYVTNWTTATTFTGGYNAAYDLDWDNAGNIYVYGGYDPSQLVKYNAAGVKQWSYTTSNFVNSEYYGGMCVDKGSGTSFATAGFAPSTADIYIDKLTSAGALSGTFYPANTGLDELWRASYDLCDHIILLGGGGNGTSTSAEQAQAATMDTNLTTLTLANVIGAPAENGFHDMALIATDPIFATGYLASTKSTSLSSPNLADNVVISLPLPAMLPVNYTNVPDNYGFKEIGSISYVGAGVGYTNGMNGMAVSPNWLYMYDGKTLEKHNKGTGTLVSSVVIGTTQYKWGGLAVDLCDNIYVGNATDVYVYNAALTLTGTIGPFSGNVYSVSLSKGRDSLYVCGKGFVSTVSLNNPANNEEILMTRTNAVCGCNGTATAQLEFCDVPYTNGGLTYKWSNGATTSSVTGLCAGVDTVTITVGCLITIKDTVLIKSTSGTLSISTSQVNATCGTLGSATVTASGGVPAYTYAWSPIVGSNAAITGLSAGNYTITVTDHNGCTATASVTITQTSTITATTTPTDPLCNGGTGSATVTAGGGSAPYTYSWSTVPVQTNAAATGLTAGNYTVTVKDNNGCTATASVTITQPTPVTATLVAITDPPCNGGTGSATYSGGGGTPGYTYNWSPSGVSNATATGLSIGSYTITVKDANGCTATASITITQPTPVTATLGPQTGPLCNGGAATDQVTAGGGTPGYTYIWSPIGGSNAIGTGLTAGSYTVTVTDANGCSATASITITQPTAVTATLGTQTGPLCNGGAATDQVTAGGGSPNYTYSWSPIGGSNAIGTGLTAGNYTVTVKDANGCTATASVTITQPLPLNVAMTSTGASCNLLNGSATATVTNGTPLYQYVWTPSGGTNATASNISAGNYTVTVTDANGCTITASVAVTQPSAITATMGAITDPLCNGGTGMATVNVAGGNLPYTYAWSTTPTQSNATATGLTVGSYTVTVTDLAGCISTASVTITQPTPVTATMGAANDPLCSTGTGSATVTPGGGTPGYIYSWSPSGGNAATATGLTAGSYTVTVTDANGCAATASVTITIPPALTATLGIITYPLCNGGTGTAILTAGGGTPAYLYNWSPTGGSNAMGTGMIAGNYTVTVTDANGCTITASVAITQPAPLTAAMSFTQASCNLSNGSVTVTPGGGTPNYTYLWNPGGGTSPTQSNVSAGSYTVTVKDVNGCTITASVTVTQPSAVMASIASNTNVSCFGGSNATATAGATGGTTPYTYSWSTTPTQSNATATGLSMGTYTVTVTDNTGCISTVSVSISQPTQLTATMGTPTDPLCFDGLGTAGVTPAGGTGPYAYVWTPNGGSGATGTGLTAGDYTVTVTDANGCTATASVSITQPTAVTATMGAATNIVCNGGTGSVTVTPGGGTPGYLYTWTPSGGSNATATGLTANSYTVTVKDANGCTATASVTITQPLVLAATATFTQASCNLPNGSTTVNPTGGTTPYQYSWNPSAQTNATATGLTVGCYTVTVKDAHGCTVTTATCVTQPSAVVASISGSTGAKCNGGATGTATGAGAGGTAPYTYSWSTVPVQTNATATGLTTGSYTVTVKDNNGCSSTASVTITEPLVLAVSISGPQVLCAGSTGTYIANVSGGTAPYIYAWSSGGTSSTTTETPLTPQTYTVNITDANGCTASAQIATNFGPPLFLSISGAKSVCNGKSTTLCAVASGGTGGYNYTWEPGGSTDGCITVSPTAATSYTLQVQDNCGATLSTSATVAINPYPAIGFYADVYQGCAPLCIQFRNTTTAGAGAQYIWSLGNGDTLQSQSPIYCYTKSGSYDITLTVTSDSGCSATLKKDNVVTVYTPPNAAFSESPQPASILTPTIQFNDMSTDAYGLVYWSWNFGDGTDSTSTLRYPSHTYQDTGTYCANLIVMDIHGCTDTATNCLVISPAYSLYIPSAFTPNGDGLNETFKPKGEYIKSFDMYIFDRWGMKLYHTTDINQGWPGTVDGGTTIAQEDTYVYRIIVFDSQGNEHSYIGNVSIIK